MNRLALGIALISRLNQELLQEKQAQREAHTNAIPAGWENRVELRRSAFQKPRRGFQSSPRP